MFKYAPSLCQENITPGLNEASKEKRSVRTRKEVTQVDAFGKKMEASLVEMEDNFSCSALSSALPPNS